MIEMEYKKKLPVIDAKKLREVAGAFPTGVTVITTEKEDGSIHGMTASSFLSISLDPALVSFCIKKEATLFPLLEVEKTVGISILTSDQSAISNKFAGYDKDNVEIKMKTMEAGATVIEGALAYYSTEVVQIIPTGDHYLILCEIHDLKRSEEGNPLVYWSGYRTVSKTCNDVK